MKYLRIILLITMSLLVAACGKDDDGGQSKKAAAAAPAAVAPAAREVAAEISRDVKDAIEGMPGGGTRYIDHAKDEIEFGLKKTLAGLESLLEDVSDSEQVAMIKKDIAELKSKLAKL